MLTFSYLAGHGTRFVWCIWKESVALDGVWEAREGWLGSEHSEGAIPPLVYIFFR